MQPPYRVFYFLMKLITLYPSFSQYLTSDERKLLHLPNIHKRNDMYFNLFLFSCTKMSTYLFFSIV